MSYYTTLTSAYHRKSQMNKKFPHVIEKFESGEHVSMADGLVVTDSTGLQRQYVPPVFIPLPGPVGSGNYSNNFKINMDTGDTFTFGQLLALSGDFFWGRKQVSDYRGDDTAAMTRFLMNFNTLNNPFNGGDPDVQVFVNQSDDTVSDQARQIIELINEEINDLRAAIQNSQSVRGVFYTPKREESDLDFVNITRKPGTKAYSSIISAALDMSSTGGGRYLQLALKNNDHFANDAEYTYTIGHTAALIEARKGYETDGDIAFYHRALAMDAMSCHFLSDTFAGGHARTNARDIRDGPGASLDWSTSVAGLLVKIQHDEENTRGLNVRNALGNQWSTYGDKNLFRPENAASRAMQTNAIQSSINEIWLAFSTGVITLPSDYKALTFMPKHGNPGSTLTPTGGYTGDIVYLDKIPGSGSRVCYAPSDCSDLGPPTLWGDLGLKNCSFSGHKRMCQRIADLNDYAPFWTVSDGKLWRRKGRDRDIPEGKQMERAYSSIDAERAYAPGLDLKPSPILPPTSQDSTAYNLQSYPLAPNLQDAKTGQYPLRGQSYYFK
jgi:hypothetical protein